MDGIWLPTHNVGGFAAMRAVLKPNTYLQCLHIKKEKKGNYIGEQDAQLLEDVHQIQAQEQDNNVNYDQLSRSISPEINGLEDEKKALLLLLDGGVTKISSADNM
eukprot:806613_1